MLIALGWPGIKWATSPVKENVDICVVDMTGNKSTSLVNNGTLVLMAKSAPMTLFLNGSEPKSTFCVTGLSVILTQVAPTLSLSLKRYW